MSTVSFIFLDRFLYRFAISRLKENHKRKEMFVFIVKPPPKQHGGGEHIIDFNTNQHREAEVVVILSGFFLDLA